MSGIRLRSARFRAEREASWRELEELLGRAESRGIRKLSASELERLPQLYRAALSSLSVARETSLEGSITEYLAQLTERAYIVVYANRMPAWRALVRFFTATFPATVYRERWFVFAAAAILISIAGLSFFAVMRDPNLYYSLMEPSLIQGRSPATTTQELRAGLYDSAGSTVELLLFAVQLLKHNLTVTLRIVPFAMLFGIPVVYILYINGTTLGAFTALYAGRGLGIDVLAWILPHGIPEFTAVFLGGAGGLIVAHALLFPGNAGRMARIRERGASVGVLLLGCVLLLILAAIIEGIARQAIPVFSYRLLMIALQLPFWGWYFFWLGRRQAAKLEEARP